MIGGVCDIPDKCASRDGDGNNRGQHDKSSDKPHVDELSLLRDLGLRRRWQRRIFQYLIDLERRITDMPHSVFSIFLQTAL